MDVALCRIRDGCENPYEDVQPSDCQRRADRGQVFD